MKKKQKSSKKTVIPKNLDIEEMVERAERQEKEIERKKQEQEDEMEKIDKKKEFIQSLQVENVRNSTHKREFATEKRIQVYLERKKAQDAEDKRREDLLKAMNKLEEREEK